MVREENCGPTPHTSKGWVGSLDFYSHEAITRNPNNPNNPIRMVSEKASYGTGNFIPMASNKSPCPHGISRDHWGSLDVYPNMAVIDVPLPTYWYSVRIGLVVSQYFYHHSTVMRKSLQQDQWKVGGELRVSTGANGKPRLQSPFCSNEIMSPSALPLPFQSSTKSQLKHQV